MISILHVIHFNKGDPHLIINFLKQEVQLGRDLLNQWSGGKHFGDNLSRILGGNIHSGSGCDTSRVRIDGVSIA